MIRIASNRTILSISQPTQLSVVVVALCISIGASAQVAAAQQSDQSQPADKLVPSQTVYVKRTPPLPAVLPPAVHLATSGHEEDAALNPKFASPSPATPGREGLKVHGHWEFIVQNPDGSVAKHFEFENSLVTGNYQYTGDYFLVALMGGLATPMQYSINVDEGAGVICDPAGVAPGCYIVSTPSSFLYSYFSGPPNNLPTFTGLTTTVVQPSASGASPVTPPALRLMGYFIATNAGQIGKVSVDAVGCATLPVGATYPQSTISPGTCQASNSVSIPNNILHVDFTRTYLSQPQQIVAGQLVQVIVTITFS
jgi:hypothetical protein